MMQGIGGLPQAQAAAQKTAQLAPELKMAMAMQSVAKKQQQAKQQGAMQQQPPQGTIVQQLQAALQGIDQELGVGQGAPSKPPSMQAGIANAMAKQSAQANQTKKAREQKALQQLLGQNKPAGISGLPQLPYNNPQQRIPPRPFSSGGIVALKDGGGPLHPNVGSMSVEDWKEKFKGCAE